MPDEFAPSPQSPSGRHGPPTPSSVLAVPPPSALLPPEVASTQMPKIAGMAGSDGRVKLTDMSDCAAASLPSVFGTADVVPALIERAFDMLASTPLRNCTSSGTGLATSAKQAWRHRTGDGYQHTSTPAHHQHISTSARQHVSMHAHKQSALRALVRIVRGGQTLRVATPAVGCSTPLRHGRAHDALVFWFGFVRTFDGRGGGVLHCRV